MPFDISETGHEEEQEAFQYYASHLICLAGLSQPLQDGKPKGEAHCFFCSGLVIVIRQRWYFVTAGHIVEEIDSSVEKGLAAR